MRALVIVSKSPLSRGRGVSSIGLPWERNCEELWERFCLAFRTDFRENPSTLSTDGGVVDAEDIALEKENEVCKTTHQHCNKWIRDLILPQNNMCISVVCVKIYPINSPWAHENNQTVRMSNIRSSTFKMNPLPGSYDNKHLKILPWSDHCHQAHFANNAKEWLIFNGFICSVLFGNNPA